MLGATVEAFAVELNEGLEIARKAGFCQAKAALKKGEVEEKAVFFLIEIDDVFGNNRVKMFNISRPDGIVELSAYESLQTFSEGKNQINGAENFWNQAKRTLRKCNGIAPQNFNYFLKEGEFRFTYGSPSEQLKMLQKWCKIYLLSTATYSFINQLFLSKMRRLFAMVADTLPFFSWW